MSSSPLTHGLMGKRILLGVSGGIAAYKSAYLARLLKKEGADVRVVMTEGAHAFITPLTFQALTGNSVHDTLLDADAEAGMGHIELARWADIILIAPGSADLIARLAQGFANDLLTTLCLASNAKRFIAPAMNQQMWAAPAVQRNVAQLVEDAFTLIGPAAGEQACGDVGEGRMLEPEEIVNVVVSSLQPSDSPDSATSNPTTQSAAGLKIVITAGPTQEALDPVRYLSNHSSGKMGYALATAAQQLGAKVTLISGPVALKTPEGVSRIDVTTADEMMSAASKACEQADIFISSAAVSDYRPAEMAQQKIKKGESENMTISLIKNPDIVATIASQDNAPFVVGFAAETDSLETYAVGKLNRKRLDMIVANQVGNGLVFGRDENAATLYWKSADDHLEQRSFPSQSKTSLAHALLTHIFEQQHAHHSD